MFKKSICLSFVLTILLVGIGNAGEKYALDKSHTTIGFSVKHLVISNTTGKFNDFSGSIVYDEANITKSSVNVTIKTSSIDTDDEKRDGHLKNADFLDVEKYPEITFVSKKIVKKKDRLVAVGDLTMHGVKKEVELAFEITGQVKDPWGNTRIGFEAEMSLNRFDYGVKFDTKLEAGGLIVGEKVQINIAGEGIKQ